jgi:hypothetical protein
MEVSGQLHAPATLPSGKEPGTHWRGGWGGGAQSRSGRSGGEERKSHHYPSRESNSGRGAFSLVFILTWGTPIISHPVSYLI